MKCAFCNVGTRGDLQPLIALALGLQKKGGLDLISGFAAFQLVSTIIYPNLLFWGTL